MNNNDRRPSPSLPSNPSAVCAPPRPAPVPTLIPPCPSFPIWGAPLSPRAADHPATRLGRARLQDNSYEVVKDACDPANKRVVEHPVAFVMRDRYTHTLHELEVGVGARGVAGLQWCRAGRQAGSAFKASS